MQGCLLSNRKSGGQIGLCKIIQISSWVDCDHINLTYYSFRSLGLQKAGSSINFTFAMATARVISYDLNTQVNVTPGYVPKTVEALILGCTSISVLV